jgi:hypothetical protein
MASLLWNMETKEMLLEMRAGGVFSSNAGSAYVSFLFCGS